ncbi:hypothetical protein LIU_00620 [Enterococcus durans]|nr:hypothetical protein LIU_00620 [Enterococcus durans]
MRSRQKSFRFDKLERKTNNTLFVLLVFFLKFPKNLIFRFVPYSFIIVGFEDHLYSRQFRKASNEVKKPLKLVR